MTEQPQETQAPKTSYPDPMKGFRGVMAATLILEAIVVALALLVIANLYGGLSTVLGVVVGVVALAHVVCCALLRHSWNVLVILGLQVVLVACVLASAPVGIVGLLFAAIWALLLWMRRDVARRMAQGLLPGQQTDQN